MKLLLRALSLVVGVSLCASLAFGMEQRGKKKARYRSQRVSAEASGSQQKGVNYAAGAVFYAIDEKNCCRILLGVENGKLSSFGGRAGLKEHPLETAIEASGREMLGLLSADGEAGFIARFREPFERGKLFSIGDTDEYTLYFIDISDLARDDEEQADLVLAFSLSGTILNAAHQHRGKDSIAFVPLDTYFRLLDGEVPAVERALGIPFFDGFAMLSLRNKKKIKEFFCKITHTQRKYKQPRKRAKAAKIDE